MALDIPSFEQQLMSDGVPLSKVISTGESIEIPIEVEDSTSPMEMDTGEGDEVASGEIRANFGLLVDHSTEELLRFGK